MRTYIYTFQDSAGNRHEGEICADSKDAAFAELRSKGIHPIRVNERIRPIVRSGLRGMKRTELALLILVVVGIAFTCVLALRPLEWGTPAVERRSYVQQSLPRHIIVMPSESELTNIFPVASHRYLARYAVPGAAAARDEVLSVEELMCPISLEPTDSEPVRELKRIVIGMQVDARRYLTGTNGVAKLREFVAERYAMEHLRFSDLMKRVGKGEMTVEDANAVLRGMGLQNAK